MDGLNGFKPFENDIMTPDVIAIIQKNNGFKYTTGWATNASFQRGTDFIVTTMDGSFYKVDAEYMVWTYIDGQFGSQAIWSGEALQRTLKSFMLTGIRTNDPDYQS